jgi:hypothetical protein
VREEERKQKEKENKKFLGHLSTLSILKDLRFGASMGVRSPDEILFSVFCSCIEKIHSIKKIILILKYAKCNEV